MDSSVVVTAYYVQNLIQLTSPSQTSKIMDKLRMEKMFVDVDDNLNKLARKVAKDGKKVALTLLNIENGVNTALDKTGLNTALDKSGSKKLTKKVFSMTKGMTDKIGTKTMVGIIGKKVPILSAGVGTGLALWRILENPHSEEAWIKAGAEVASGTASCFPGVGTALSLTIDGILVASDLDSAKQDELLNGPNSEEKNKKIKKHKIPIPSLFSFSYQGNDFCLVTKLANKFRVPHNFEIWFFCSHDSIIPNHIQVDVMFYIMIAKEASLHKINYTECVSPSSYCEKLCSGDMSDDYKMSLIGDGSDQLDNVFYLGLTKWTPKMEPTVVQSEPIIEENLQYFTLSQLVCDLGRKENYAQKCVLLFLCNRTENSDEENLSEKVTIWRERVKCLIPSFPEPE